jgi:immune inhibitor A
MEFRNYWLVLATIGVLIGCSTDHIKEAKIPIATSASNNEKLSETLDSILVSQPMKLDLKPTSTPIPADIDFWNIPPDRNMENLAKRYRSHLALDQNISQGQSWGKQGKLGEEVIFTVTDPVSAQTYKVQARLINVTQNVHWYLDESLDVDPAFFTTIGKKWEADIRPKIVSVFGDINRPGIDGDDHLTVLNTPLNGVVGYFGSQDTQYSWVHPSSNEREMVYMDPEKLSPLTSKYLAVLTHEFQHAIHDKLDRGEESWVNEGLSEVASYIAGFESSFTHVFLDSPSISLVHWPGEPSETVPHYGAASLFFMFAAGRNGGLSSLGDLAYLGEDGIDGVDDWLSFHGSSFDHEFTDWIVANYVGSVDGRYSYSDWTLAVTSKASLLPWGGSRHQISQYGASYLEIPRPGDTTGESTLVSLRGDQESHRFLTKCPSKCWWSNNGDSINTKLTLDLDLRDVSNPYVSFESWHDIEKDWDYAYISVSKDGDNTWKTLRASGTTDLNPSGSNYGNGYTGYRDWDTRLVNLDQYSGSKIQLRFEYVTDDAVYRDGFLLGSVEIPALNLILEPDDMRWNSEGFVLIDGPLKQNFVARVIKLWTNGDFSVVDINFDEFNRVQFEIEDFGEKLERAVLVLSGVTRGTTHPTSIKIDTIPMVP